MAAYGGHLITSLAHGYALQPLTLLAPLARFGNELIRGSRDCRVVSFLFTENIVCFLTRNRSPGIISRNVMVWKINREGSESEIQLRLLYLLNSVTETAKSLERLSNRIFELWPSAAAQGSHDSQC